MNVFAALLVLAVVPAPSCDPAAVFAAVRTAMGGGAALRSAGPILATSGTLRALGFRGTYARTVDLRDGRSSVSTVLGPVTERDVNDGRLIWQQDYSGGVHPRNTPNARAAAVTQAYLNRFGFLAPALGGAAAACRPTRREGARTFYAIALTPPGGLAVEQWIDAETMLIDRTIQTTPTSTKTEWTSDYRRVGSLVLPFQTRETVAGDPSDDAVAYARSYAFVSPAPAGAFARPADPDDTQMLGGARSTTVPITVEAGDAIVQARINGKGPFPFILDTGGHAIVTPQAARAIGLTAQGAGSSGGAGSGRVGLSFARARSLRIGDALVPNQTLLVIPYDNDFSDRGKRPPLAGILGLELFERFAIRIDYARATLTLTPLRGFQYRGNGRALPLVFQDDMPIARARADGTPGWFGIDTGNSGTPILFGPYLQRNGFLQRYSLGAVSMGSGTGGAVRSFRQELGRLDFGGRTFAHVPAFFVVGQRGGSFSSTTEAGNIGYQTLANFTPTFDYAAGTAYLEAAPHPPPPAYNRSGMGLSKIKHDAFTVASVRPQTPAAKAGIAPGDTIVAIDGTPARDLGDADAYAIMRQPAGTIVTVKVVRKGVSRTLRIRLA